MGVGGVQRLIGCSPARMGWEVGSGGERWGVGSRVDPISRERRERRERAGS